MTSAADEFLTVEQVATEPQVIPPTVKTWIQSGTLQPPTAVKDNLTAADVVHRLCDEEKQSRMRSAVDRRIKAARFPEVNTVDGFDFDFDPCRKKAKARYLALHDLAFVDKGINPLFIEKPGTGKTFLARAMAYRACQAARRVALVTAPRMLNELHGAELHGALDRVHSDRLASRARILAAPPPR